MDAVRAPFSSCLLMVSRLFSWEMVATPAPASALFTASLLPRKLLSWEATV